MGTTPQSVTAVAVQRAVLLLNAAKVEYAIRMPDGEILGALPVGKKAGTPRRKVNDFRALVPGYIDQVAALEPGGVARWRVDAHLADPFRKCVASVATQRLGQGHCITAIVGEAKDIVEVLRVE